MLDQQTWIAVVAVLVGFAGVGLTLAGLLRGITKDLKTDNQATRDELGARIDKVDASLGARIDKVDGRVDTLDGKIDKAREESKAEIADLRNDFRFLNQTIVDFLAHPPQRTSTTQGE